jgi:hypothetical protein
MAKIKSTNNIYKTYRRTDSTMAKIKSIKVQTTSTKHIEEQTAQWQK